jgi:hypothetical protein
MLALEARQRHISRQRRSVPMSEPDGILAIDVVRYLGENRLEAVRR